jgi:hypothetical protein
MYQGFVPNHVCFVHTATVRACHRRLSRLVEKVGRQEGQLQHGACRATKNKKKNEEVDVWVVTRGGEKTRAWTLSMVKAQVRS